MKKKTGIAGLVIVNIVLIGVIILSELHRAGIL